MASHRGLGTPACGWPPPGLKDRTDVSAAVPEFSGRTPIVADLLAELLRHAPKELAEFLLRTSVADVLDASCATR